MRLILASASPRRAEILRDAGIAFDVLAVDVDETPRPGESAEAMCRRLAEAKAPGGRFPGGAWWRAGALAVGGRGGVGGRKRSVLPVCPPPPFSQKGNRRLHRHQRALGQSGRVRDSGA